MAARAHAFLFSLLCLAAAICAPRATQGAGSPLVTVAGWFSHSWMCDWEHEMLGSHRASYAVHDAAGNNVELVIEDHLLAEYGGPTRLVGKWVVAQGPRVAPGPSATRPDQPAIRAQRVWVSRDNGALSSPGGAVLGNRRYVTILCRFADTTGSTPQTTAHFAGLFGTNYPGLDHYYREVSDDQINLSNSTVVGWYNLPQNRSAYMTADGCTVDFSRVLNDAVSAADGDVFFPDYAGINVVFNVSTSWFWGGGFSLNRDGQNKAYGVTWVGYNVAQATMAHEIGHSLGLPHSSGPYNAVYDSRWDVMSGGGGNADATYGSVGCGTIAYHKDLLGWLPSSQVVTVDPGVTRTVTLERLNDPQSGANALMVKVPIFGLSELYYTIEARFRNGYDATVPDEGVLIHLVDPSRYGGSPARVFDQDENGNSNDASAIWKAGEVMDDPANRVRISVESAGGSNFVVTVENTGVASAACGIAAVYYDNVDLTGTSVSRLDPTIYYNWASGSPASQIAADTFSARWTGILTAPLTGAYTFHTQTDDGVRLYLDGVTLIDQWVDQGVVEHTAQVNLTAGDTYTLRMDYYERGGSASSKLLWTPPGKYRTHIPPGVLCGSTPAAPSNLTARAVSSTQIDLAWTDNSVDEGSFSIERRMAATAFLEVATTSANVTAYADTGLAPGTTYTYRVRAVNSIGASGPSNEASDTTFLLPPAPPSGLAAVCLTSRKIRLTWSDNSNGESGFEIERRTGAVFSRIVTTAANAAQYVDTGLTLGVTYIYRVRAVNAAGNSAYTSEASATTIINPPQAPDSLGATAAAHNRIGLGWRDRSFNEEGFRIERKSGGGSFANAGSAIVDATNHVDQSVQPNTTYTYRVVAFNEDGVSGPSNEASATTPLPPPNAPSDLTAQVVSPTRALLNWSDNSDDENGFRVERRIVGQNYTQIATLPAGVTNLPDFGLAGNTQYVYRVRAFNQNGNSSYSNEAAATTPPNVPAAPGNLRAAGVGGVAIRLDWTDQSDNEDGFRIERRTALGQFATIGAGGRGQVTFQDANVTSGTTYVYRVFAYNGDGDSAASNEAALTMEPVPSPPNGLSATPRTATSIVLFWMDRSNNENGFQVDRKVGNAAYQVLGATQANVSTYVDEGLAANTTYTYRVSAFNGGGASGYSAPAAAVIGARGLLRISPTSLNFGRLRAGRSATRVVRLRNAGTGALGGQVGGVGAPFTVLQGEGPFTLLPGRTVDVQLRFTASARGTVTGALPVWSTDPSKTFSQIRLSGAGR